MPRQFLYCIEAAGSGMAKVGCAQWPRQRLGQVRLLVPHELRLRHVVRFDDIARAYATERCILNQAQRVRGEWVRLDAALDALFAPDALPGGEVVTAEYVAAAPGGRHPPPLSGDDADLAERLAAVPIPADPRRAIARDAIEAGFGWEDVLVKHGISREVYWSVAHELGFTGEAAA